MAKYKKIKNRAKPRSLAGRLIPVGAVVALCAIAWFASTLDLMPDTETVLADPIRYQGLAKTVAVELEKEFTILRKGLRDHVAIEQLVDRVQADSAQLLNTGNWQTPYLLSARLLATGVTRTNDAQMPPLSYACFDLVYNVEHKGEETALEVHKFGQAEQHIDLVEPVKNAAGEVTGTLVASYNIALLQQGLNKMAVADSYVEIQQGSVILASRGLQGARIGDAISSPIKGTHWRLALWKPVAQASAVQSFVWGKLALVVGLVVLVLLVAGALGWRENKRLAAMPDMPNEYDAASASSDLVVSTDDAAATDVIFQGSNGLIVDEEDVEDEEADNMTEQVAVMPEASIFKAYDIRGIVDKTLTVTAVRQIGQALGSEALARGEKQMVVARDGRISGPKLIAALEEGLLASGINVLNVGMVPTPVLYYAAWKFAHGTGVMLTGSHNPPDYNGLKMVIGETTLASEEIQKLRGRIESGDMATGKGIRQEKDVLDSYIKRITGDVMLLRRFKVVVDCGNGVAGVVAPRLLNELGCEVIELFSEVDGNFPNHHPDPSKPENLKDLISMVLETGADLGLAFDGDGDRLGVITSEGKVIWPDRAMMLYAENILSRNPGAEVIYDVKCSTHLAEVIRQYGGKATMWNTGHSLIKAKMKETGALLAGEMSGHIFFKERWYGFDDATYTAARLLELLGPKSKGGPVIDVFNALPDSINTPEINIKMAEGAHHAFIKKFVEKARFEDATVHTIDGLRADFADGWGLVRASNTTPVLVLRFEADSDIALARIMNKFKKQMLAVDASIDLSF